MNNKCMPINVTLTKTRKEKFNLTRNTFNIPWFIKWFYEYEDLSS